MVLATRASSNPRVSLRHPLSLLTEPPDFSLVLGGPLYQLWRQSHLSGDALQLLQRRIIVMTLVAWAPLLVLSILEGQAWGGSVQLPFLYDVEQHARLLIALPLLIAGEVVAHRRMRRIPRLFLDRGLIPDSARPRFIAAIDSAMRLRNSLTVEVVMLAIVYIVGVGFFYRTKLALDVPSWYRTTVDGSVERSLAGWWLACVSLPLFQFLLLRWYFRLFVLARFLWQVSRLELKIVPTHPDRCGGLGFLASMRHAFAPLLLAEGTLLAGVMANRIFYSGATLVDFKV